jgi:outer membrane protein assembly factor BamD (BamD/ComL family)
MSHCHVYMKTLTKIISFLVLSRKKKKKKKKRDGKDSDNELYNVATDEEIKKDLLKKIEKKNIFESMCNLRDAF